VKEVGFKPGVKEEL